MKKILLFLLGISCIANSCKKGKQISISPPLNNQIIADHSIIDDFDKIPPYYISEVKKMLVYFPGESHSEAYREGMRLLSYDNLNHKCIIVTGEVSEEQGIRIIDGPRVGEAEWFTWKAFDSDFLPPTSKFIKELIKKNADEGNPINVLGFAWCYDLFSHPSRLNLITERITGKLPFRADPEYGVHWHGSSIGGPDGNRQWGLDSGDYHFTRNRVNTNTYLEATEEYINYCQLNGYPTKIIFTTGPADFFTGEAGYQGYLKHQYIRNYVTQDSSRILFDYHDILCYDENGKQTMTKWKGNAYPIISKSNLGDGSIGHIGPEGALRLAKAQWWMLARIAGWDGR